MRKNEINQAPCYFDTYISKVPDVELIEGIQNLSSNLLRDEYSKFEHLGDQVYADHKWTIKQIIQHLIDTERIFQYRALRFSRNDTTQLPGFDENLFAAEARVAHRTLNELLDEFDTVRHSTQKLFTSFNEEELLRTGICFNATMTVAGVGYTLIGHVIHHLGIIKERYYPLIA
jgi:hypothetical protein